MQESNVLVLGEPGFGREEIEVAAASFGSPVSTGTVSGRIDDDADVLVLDLRGDAVDSVAVFVMDHRPLVAVFDGPSPLAADLRRRSAPTMVMAGFSEAGFRVALATCAALRPGRTSEARKLAAAS